MKLVLISPLGDLSCDIAITDFPYVVGRNCRDFDAKAYCSGLFGAAISQVSSKHGVFTVESNQVILEDCGSMNGTTVNGTSITGTKRVLYPGDRVNFAGKLEFIIDIEYPPSALPAGKSFTLHPASGVMGLDSLQLNALPLLIGRLSPVFRKYDGLVPKSSAPLANRHARLFLKDDTVYIADLGSQSGIFVQGTQVKSGRARLASGCTLKFTDFFQYSMSELTLQAPEQPVATAAPTTAEAPTAVDDDRTVYFDESTTFMSVVSEADFNEVLEGDVESPSDAECETTLQDKVPKGLMEPKVLGGIGFFLVVLISALFLYYNSDVKKINRLLEDKQYEQSLALANSSLATDPTDPQLQSLATKALSLGLIDQYIAVMASGSDRATQELLKRYKALTSHFGDGIQVVDLFTYLYEVEQFARSKRKQGSLEYFFDVDEVRKTVPRLMQQWRSKKYEYKMLLDELVITAPAFVETRNQFYTTINHLQKIESNELPAIIKLESQIKKYLSAGMINKVRSLLERFESNYPHVEGDERWQNDLVKLQKMVALKNQGDVYEALEIAKESPMTTSLFHDIVGNWQRRNLPDQQVFQAVVQSRSYWKKGEYQQAIRELITVSEAASTGKLVADTLNHYKEVTRLYRLAQDSGGSCGRLADLYGVLTDGDTFFKNQFQQKYAACGKRISLEVSGYVQKGNDLYLTYRQTGGITGIMRMDDVVTSAFQKQAHLLVQSYDSCQQARYLVRMYALQFSDREFQIINQVEKEYNKQRTRLLENRALSPAVLEQKLDAITWKNESR